MSMRQGSRSITQLADLRSSAPAEYARALRKAHESTISGNPNQHLSPSLIKSWQRSLALGINPDQHRPIHRHEVSEARSLGAGHRLAAVMPALSQLLADETATGRHLLIVTDHEGEVLWRVGSKQALKLADSLEFVEGADWSESGVGTNAISEALVTGAPAQLFSAEHLVRTHHDWACTASPIRDPLTGEVIGVLDVSGPFESVTPDSLRLVRCGVRLAEELLKSATPPVTAGPRTGLPAASAASERPEIGVRSQLTLRLLGDAPSAALDGGARRPLTLRRAEILALLHPGPRAGAPMNLPTRSTATQAPLRRSGPRCTGYAASWATSWKRTPTDSRPPSGWSLMPQRWLAICGTAGLPKPSPRMGPNFSTVRATSQSGLCATSSMKPWAPLSGPAVTPG